MYKEESETVRRYFMNFAKHKVASKYTMVDMNALASGEDKQIKRMIVKCMEEVRISLGLLFNFKVFMAQIIGKMKGLLDFAPQLPQFAAHSQPNRVDHSRKRQSQHTACKLSLLVVSLTNRKQTAFLAVAKFRARFRRTLRVDEGEHCQVVRLDRIRAHTSVE
jgi:hypothetical protein